MKLFHTSNVRIPLPEPAIRETISISGGVSISRRWRARHEVMDSGFSVAANRPW